MGKTTKGVSPPKFFKSKKKKAVVGFGKQYRSQRERGKKKKRVLSILGTNKVGQSLGLAGKVVRTIGIGVCQKESKKEKMSVKKRSKKKGRGEKCYMRTIVVSMVIVALLRTNVFHLVHTTALGAAFNGTVARHGEPGNDVRVGRAAGAANILLIAKGAYDNGVLQGTCCVVVEKEEEKVNWGWFQ
jgi:hypothetical protein